MAEGLWKWKLFDYQKNESHDNFNELFQSISQYLTLNKDKRKLRLQYPKMIDEGAHFIWMRNFTMIIINSLKMLI